MAAAATSILPHHATTPTSDAAASRRRERRYFDVPASQWLWDTIFMLSMSLAGLGMPLGNLVVIVMMVRAFKTDREGFLFMLLLVAGGYALTAPTITWYPINNLLYIMLVVAAFAAFALRQYKILTRTLILYGVYALTTFFFALNSEEKLGPQMGKMLNYLSFITFTVPLLCFVNKPFDIHRFWCRAFSMQLIICVFYILDAYIFRGWVLVPYTHIDLEGTQSLWNNLIMNGPFGNIPRKWPPGLFPLGLLMFPLARYYKLRWWQWVIILLSLACSRTFTMWIALLAGYVVSMGSLGKYMKYAVAGAAVLTILYVVDDSMGYGGENNDQSTLRISSSVNQIINLGEVDDDEDLAEFGSNRMAQLLPCLDHIYERNEEWFGEGFIPLDTQNPRYLIKNEFFEYEGNKYTTCQFVEIIQAQIFLEVGYVGFAIHCLFLLGLWLLIRKLRYSAVFLSMMVVLIIYGTAGFRGWHDSQGIYLGAFAYAAVMLANRPNRDNSLQA